MGHLTDMVKAAAESDYRQTALWAANDLFAMNRQKSKPSVQTYILLRDVYAKIEAYTRAFQACQQALLLKPRDEALEDSLRDLSAQATMEQGKYDKDGDFRDSIKDREDQTKLQNQEKVVQSTGMRMDAIEAARREYEADPQVSGKISKLVDALCATEKTDRENEAIEILEKAYAESSQFRYKQHVGEIKIKQLNRQVRQLQAQTKNAPEDAEAKANLQEKNREILATELKHYESCVQNYPTDMRMKYEYGRRLLRAKKYDEAIPAFQEARSDPRHRTTALNCIGQCFFYKEWFADAVETFEQAIESLENPDGATGKELRYNLGRAHEADGKAEEALQCFRKVAQIDYNYLDVRDRVENLRKQLQDKDNSK